MRCGCLSVLLKGVCAHTHSASAACLLRFEVRLDLKRQGVPPSSWGMQQGSSSQHPARPSAGSWPLFLSMQTQVRRRSRADPEACYISISLNLQPHHACAPPTRTHALHTSLSRGMQLNPQPQYPLRPVNTLHTKAPHAGTLTQLHRAACRCTCRCGAQTQWLKAGSRTCGPPPAVWWAPACTSWTPWPVLLPRTAAPR